MAIQLRKLDQSPQFEDKKSYEKALDAVQLRLLKIQQAYLRQGRRAIVVFEGWDCAGKGGAIRRLTARLDPRGFQVWPISAPTPEELGHHYLWRFWQRMPGRGVISIFDRSWYGRVLVERVEGYAADREWERAYDEINAFEELLVRDDVRIVKLLLHLTADEQLRRFVERLEVPYKRWKLTAEDLRNYRRRADYETAYDDMLRRTDTAKVPWHAIPSNHKWHSRVACLTAVADTLEPAVDLMPPPMDAALERELRAEIAALTRR
mgnify:CR=1 FL=1